MKEIYSQVLDLIIIAERIQKSSVAPKYQELQKQITKIQWYLKNDIDRYTAKKIKQATFNALMDLHAKNAENQLNKFTVHSSLNLWSRIFVALSNWVKGAFYRIFSFLGHPLSFENELHNFQNKIIRLKNKLNNPPLPYQEIVALYPYDEEIVMQCYTAKPSSLYFASSQAVATLYQNVPASIKYANKEVINHLGRNNIIKAENVAAVFSISLPTPEEELQRNIIFNEAVSSRNWSEVLKICDKFWFEKPVQADKKEIWERIYQKEREASPKKHGLTCNPLMKSLETRQLEELMRQMMANGHFDIQTRNGDDYFVFNDGCEFNWTQIRSNYQMQHIDLNQEDFSAYQKFIESPENISEAKSKLINKRTQIQEYLNELYKNSPKQERLMSFAEMQAINIYTSDFYKAMNGLLRDETSKFDYRKEPHQRTRAALIHSVMCASGLRKAPTANYKVSYRGASYDSDEAQLERLKIAAQEGVIYLDGFISSSVDAVVCADQFNKKQLLFTFKNLKGVYIEPISQKKQEKEFLIPACHVQLLNYKLIENRHHFEASIVFESKTKANLSFFSTAETASPSPKVQATLSS